MPEIIDMPPLINRPLPLVVDLAERMNVGQGLATSVHGLLSDANIKIAVEGENASWAEEGQGVLLLGDHRQRVEYIPIVGVMGELGRNDVHVIAKPYTRTARAVGSLGMVEAAGVILPVVPRNLASDCRNIWNRNVYYRVLRHRHLPTTQQIRDSNSSTLKRCGDLLHAGDAINLYPTGAVRDALTAPWYPGIGKLIKDMSEADRDTVMIVPFRFDDFSVMRFMRALRAYRQGKPLRTQELCMKVGHQGTPNELLGTIDGLDATDITEKLQGQFVDAFTGR